MRDIDIREGLDEIDEAVERVVAGEPHEIWNSDRDMDDSPAPRAVMVSAPRYEELLDYEFRYKGLCK